MKRILCVLLICTLMFSLVSCGNSTTEKLKNEPVSAGYLPTRMEDVSEGGTVPEGNEAETALETGAYAIESLWGTWVPESTADADGTISAYSATYTDEETGEAGEGYPIELNLFPKSLSFKPPWESVSRYAISVGSQHSFYSTEMNEEETVYENTALGDALLSNGLGQGNVSYDYAFDESVDTNTLISLGYEGDFAAAYGISGNTLAVGLLSSSDSEPENFDIEEIDYTISYSGWKLTLTYGEQSVTYIPENFDASEMIDLYKCGTEPDYENADGLFGINLQDDVQQVMYDLHEGYVDAEFDFGEDGVLTISSADQEAVQYHYLVSEYCLTLISETGQSIFSYYREKLESTNVSAGTSGGIITELGGTLYIVAAGEKTSIYPTTDFQDLLDAGFTTTLDSNQTMTPCVVSDAITLEKGGASIQVKVVNPWAAAVALKECKVCDIYVDDATGTITYYDDSEIGTTEYDTIEQYFEAAYEKTSDLLRYKVNCVDFDTMLDDLATMGSTHENELLDTQTTEMEILYHFKNGVLCAYELRCPELLFNSLQDNVDNAVLENMNSAAMTDIVEVRDDVMQKLKNAFDSAGVNVTIDDTTGEIVLDSSVLFDYDSSELSSTGQNYIDNFMGVYASVILDDSLKDTISEVRFEGHTDSSGTYDYNLELSQARANAVLEYCLSSEESGMNRSQKERLNEIASTIGYSYADLVYDENGEEDADASRRVAIKFYINVDAGNNSDAIDDTVTTEPTSDLTGEDFILTYEGENIDVRTLTDGNTIYCHYDGEENTKTARGVRLGDSKKNVLDAYGDTTVYEYSDDCLFSSENGFPSEMANDTQAYVLYLYEDKGMLGFLFDEWNCVSWIVLIYEK